jgi:hypothetical protein
MKEFEEKQKQRLKKEDQFAFMTDVRKRLSEVVNSVADIHVSETRHTSPTHENVVIDIIVQKRKRS